MILSINYKLNNLILLGIFISLTILKIPFLSKLISSFWQEVWNWDKGISSCKHTKISTVSAIAISLKYLYRRPLPYLGCNSCCKGSTGSYLVLLVLDF